MPFPIPENSLICIKDGVYIGDASATKVSSYCYNRTNHHFFCWKKKHLNLLVRYKIFNIVNCAPGEITNMFGKLGMKYLDLAWEDDEQAILLDDDNRNFDLFYKFIHNAKESLENVLIASVNGKTRACVVAIAWLMKRYKSMKGS